MHFKFCHVIWMAHRIAEQDKTHCFHLPSHTAAHFKGEFRAGDTVLAAAVTTVVTSSATALHMLLQPENTELDLKRFLTYKSKRGKSY